MKTIERIYKYIEYRNITPAIFEKKTGVSNGYLGKQLKRMADIGESITTRIIENCPDIDPLWLLTGKGEMLRSNPDPANVHNEKEQKPPTASAPEPEMSAIYSMMFERIENMARENALLNAENKQLQTEIGQLKAENEELKKCKPRPSRYSFDSDSHNPPMVVDKSESEECKLEA
jgi:hypothetical protein